LAAKRKHKAWETVYVALGSNIEPRDKYIERALNGMNDHKQIEVVQVSSIYETKPIGEMEDQGDFLNGVVEIRTKLQPDELLDALLAVEEDLGRVREHHWGPRTIDLDILLFGDRIVSTERLSIPHALMHERRFVMQGLAEIAPEISHPLLQMSAMTILESMGDLE